MEVQKSIMQDEVNPVMSALLDSGLEVTALHIVAIHHHMVGEQPRTIFLHYWGHGPAESLAEAVKTALQATRTIDASSGR